MKDFLRVYAGIVMVIAAVGFFIDPIKYWAYSAGAGVFALGCVVVAHYFTARLRVR